MDQDGSSSGPACVAKEAVPDRAGCYHEVGLRLRAKQVQEPGHGYVAHQIRRQELEDAGRPADVLSRLAQYPLVCRYLGRSFAARATRKDWYENRFIRYLYVAPDWVEDIERTFAEARLDVVRSSGSDGILGTLTGQESDYDGQLFDALSEVRLVRWAWSQGYESAEKLVAQHGRTPDFILTMQGRPVVAEAKHFRPRDYVVEFVEDRLDGLVLKTGGFRQMGLFVDSGYDYDRRRYTLVGARAHWRLRYLDAIRRKLTEEWLGSAERALVGGTQQRMEILGGRLAIEPTRHGSPGRVRSSLLFMADPEETALRLLLKVECALLEKLRQIQSWLQGEPRRAAEAVVFFSGVDPSEMEWSVLWETMERSGAHSIWEAVSEIKTRAANEIRVPFTFIVGRGNPVEYRPFPWSPREL